MDTRNKILTLAAALEIPAPLVLVSGTFDILRAAHAREIQSAQSAAPSARLLVAVLSPAAGALSPRARAEMAAALRMVDYVVTADYEDLERLIRSLRPAHVVRLEDADARRMRQLIEHVHGRQSG